VAIDLFYRLTSLRKRPGAVGNIILSNHFINEFDFNLIMYFLEESSSHDLVFF